MSDYKDILEEKLWSLNKLRGNIELSEFKNYILGFVFYKYLSEKMEIHLNQKFIKKNLKFDKIHKKEPIADNFKEKVIVHKNEKIADNFKEKVIVHKNEKIADNFKEKVIADNLKKEAIENLGYFLKPKFFFSKIVEKARNGEFILKNLKKALNSIMDLSESHGLAYDYQGLFEDIDLNSSKLGKKQEDKNKLTAKILLAIDEIDFNLDGSDSELADAYEYLISQFASSAGKAGEFYTPKQVSKLLAKIVSIDKTELRNVYDPCCGSASLLLAVAKEIEVKNFYGQELNQSTYNLASMNMIIHNVNYHDFDIRQGDSLETPQHIDMKFEAVLSNPPFSSHWSSSKDFLEDSRFSDYGKLAPKSKADFAFVQHMIYQLADDGIMAVVLPLGVLFRAAAEGVIRKYLINDKNYLDAVISLPANIFYGTSIPTAILVFKKNRENPNDVLFIDASKNFQKAKTKNVLRDSDIDKIIKTYSNREELEKFSHIATLDEIRENDFNLNIPRYVDPFEEEVAVDVKESLEELKEIDNEVKAIDREIKKYCDELGIDSPIF